MLLLEPSEGVVSRLASDILVGAAVAATAAASVVSPALMVLLACCSRQGGLWLSVVMENLPFRCIVV